MVAGLIATRSDMKNVKRLTEWIEDNKDPDPELFAHRMHKMLKQEVRSQSIREVLTAVLAGILLIGGLVVGLNAATSTREVEAVQHELEQARDYNALLDKHVAEIAEACREVR
jgi:hypothetical protein